MSPRIGSLCSGYGGLDLAAEQHYGATTAWHCEYDKAPSAILAHSWPGVPNHGDVWATDWAAVEPIDILTAGYPCQPFSHAGKREGTNDHRHLWPGVADAVRLLRPGVVVLENVAGHLSLGFGDVLGDLAALGYDARWGCVRAADVGAPHGRLRVFITARPADAAHIGLQRGGGARGRRPGSADVAGAAADGHGAGRQGPQPAPGRYLPHGGAAADAEGDQQREPAEPRRLRTESRDGVDAGAVRLDFGPYAAAIRRWEGILGRPAPDPTEPGSNGPRLSPRFVEWMMGLPDGWVTAVPGVSRAQQLKALGNGVVPQQAAAALAWLDAAVEVAA